MNGPWKILLPRLISRLEQADIHAQILPLRTSYVVRDVVIDDHNASDNGLEVRSKLAMFEYREDLQFVFTVDCRHVLRCDNGGFWITSKRIDLVNCEAAYGIMLIPY